MTERVSLTYFRAPGIQESEPSVSSSVLSRRNRLFRCESAIMGDEDEEAMLIIREKGQKKPV
jgi:hypothetical protein